MKEDLPKQDDEQEYPRYTKEDLDELYRRLAEHKAGISKSYTMEESFELIRGNFKSKHPPTTTSSF